MSSDPVSDFADQVASNIKGLSEDKDLQGMSRVWLRETSKHGYTFNFTWLGRPIIQLPTDIVAMQELIWQVQPDLVIETGIAHGGSLIFTASMLELVASCGGPSDSKVLGIDIDIRAHNRAAIEAHPMFKRITMIEGSSIDASIIEQVQQHAASAKRIMVFLDSNHTHEHVLAELRAYAPLVSLDSYCVVLDTGIEHMPADSSPDRPWGKGDNPHTAVMAYLKENNNFRIDTDRHHKLLISVAPDGFLQRIKA